MVLMVWEKLQKIWLIFIKLNAKRRMHLHYGRNKKLQKQQQTEFMHRKLLQ